MKLFENGVGRPTNEILKKRRIFMVSIALVVTVLLFAGCYALFRMNIGKLQGATYKSGTSYTNLSVNESKIKIQGCKLIVPITVKNNLSKQMKIQGISLHYNGGKELQKVNNNLTLNGKVTKSISVTFNMSTFKNVDFSKYRYKLTIWNYFNSKGYYYDYDLFDNKSVQNAIRACKKTTGITKTVTKTTSSKKPLENIVLNCPPSAMVNQKFSCITDKAGVTISITSTNLASGYTASFKTTSKDFAKDLKYKKAGKITVTATKSGYNTVKKYVNVRTTASNEFIYYFQKSYHNDSYGKIKNATIASHGCAQTSMAMVIANLVNPKITPIDTTKEACASGYCTSTGTDNNYFAFAAKKHGIKINILPNSKKDASRAMETVKSELKKGKLVIAIVGANSPFATGGHFIVLRNYKNDKVYVADPDHPELFNTAYNLSDFWNKNWFSSSRYLAVFSK